MVSDHCGALDWRYGVWIMAGDSKADSDMDAAVKMSQESNHALHRTAAKRRGFDGAGSSDAAFAASAHFWRQSVS